MARVIIREGKNVYHLEKDNFYSIWFDDELFFKNDNISPLLTKLYDPVSESYKLLWPDFKTLEEDFRNNALQSLIDGLNACERAIDCFNEAVPPRPITAFRLLHYINPEYYLDNSIDLASNLSNHSIVMAMNLLSDYEWIGSGLGTGIYYSTMW